MDPDSPSLSGPPSVHPDSMPADRLQRNPVFERAAGRAPAGRGGRGAGRGAGRGRGRGAAAGDDAGARFERISLFAYELQQTPDDLDGLDDEPDNSGDDEAVRQMHAQVDNEEDREYDDGSDEDSGCEARPPPTQPPRSKRPAPSVAQMMGSAAFSTRAGYRDAGSDTESSVSRTSSKRKRDLLKEALPKGITCVGCAIPHRIGAVEKCVTQNIGRVADHALWRLAALTYQREVVEPARREGTEALPWSHTAIRNHFVLHSTNPAVGRTSMIQTLAAMRYNIEGRLIRVEGDEREVDKQNAELTLKVLAAESRERQLLAQGVPTKGRGAAAPPAAE